MTERTAHVTQRCHYITRLAALCQQDKWRSDCMALWWNIFFFRKQQKGKRGLPESVWTVNPGCEGAATHLCDQVNPRSLSCEQSVKPQWAHPVRYAAQSKAMCPAQPLIKYTRLRLISSSCAGKVVQEGQGQGQGQGQCTVPSDRYVFFIVCVEIKSLLWTQVSTWECLCILWKIFLAKVNMLL